jgi:hypothetical protein
MATVPSEHRGAEGALQISSGADSNELFWSRHACQQPNRGAISGGLSSSTLPRLAWGANAPWLLRILTSHRLTAKAYTKCPQSSVEVYTVSVSLIIRTVWVQFKFQGYCKKRRLPVLNTVPLCENFYWSSIWELSSLAFCGYSGALLAEALDTGYLGSF